MASLIMRLHKRGWQAFPQFDFGDHIVRMWRKRGWLCSVYLYPDLTHVVTFDRAKD